MKVSEEARVKLEEAYRNFYAFFFCHLIDKKSHGKTETSRNFRINHTILLKPEWAFGGL